MTSMGYPGSNPSAHLSEHRNTLRSRGHSLAYFARRIHEEEQVLASVASPVAATAVWRLL